MQDQRYGAVIARRPVQVEKVAIRQFQSFAAQGQSWPAAA